MVSEERSTRSSLVGAAVAVVAVLVLLYSLLIAQQLLLGVFLVVFAFLIYSWRRPNSLDLDLNDEDHNTDFTFTLDGSGSRDPPLFCNWSNNAR